jgi:transcriptional regulator of aromatic amino acid metabolism
VTEITGEESSHFSDGTHLSLHSDLVCQLEVMIWSGKVRELKNVGWQVASENAGEGGAVTLQRSE